MPIRLDKHRSVVLFGGAGPNAARAFRHHGQLGAQLLMLLDELINDAVRRRFGLA